MIFPFFIFFLSFIVLARASSFLVRSLVYLARILGWSEYGTAFIFMSLATSIPELFVGISSAISNIPEFSLGNILGANLINLTLIIGLVSILSRGLKEKGRISKKNFALISLLALAPIFLAVDGEISRWDGFFLLLLFLLYFHRLFKEKEHFSRPLNHIFLKIDYGLFKNLAIFGIGVILLIFSSYFVVWSGKILVGYLNISNLLFGILFISLGTALPELVFGIRAKLLNHSSMSLGNSLGSVAFNSVLVVGLVSVLRPIKILFSFDFLLVAVCLILALLAFNIFLSSKNFISKKEGVILVIFYLFFLVLEYLNYLFLNNKLLL